MLLGCWVKLRTFKRHISIVFFFFLSVSINFTPNTDCYPVLSEYPVNWMWTLFLRHFRTTEADWGTDKGVELCCPCDRVQETTSVWVKYFCFDPFRQATEAAIPLFKATMTPLDKNSNFTSQQTKIAIQVLPGPLWVAVRNQIQNYRYLFPPCVVFPPKNKQICLMLSAPLMPSFGIQSLLAN